MGPFCTHSSLGCLGARRRTSVCSPVFPRVLSVRASASAAFSRTLIPARGGKRLTVGATNPSTLCHFDPPSAVGIEVETPVLTPSQLYRVGSCGFLNPQGSPSKFS